MRPEKRERDAKDRDKNHHTHAASSSSLKPVSAALAATGRATFKS